MKKRVIVSFILLILIFFVIKLSIGIYTDIQNQFKMKQELIQSKEKYEKLRLEKEKFQKKLEQAKSEENKERIFRDKLNLKKEGERVYKIIEDDKNELNPKENGE